MRVLARFLSEVSTAVNQNTVDLRGFFEILKLAVDLQFRKSLVETNTVKIGLHKAKAA